MKNTVPQNSCLQITFLKKVLIKGGLSNCAKGKTKRSLTLNVLSGDTDSFEQFLDVIYERKRIFYRENKELSSLSDLMDLVITNLNVLLKKMNAHKNVSKVLNICN